MAPLYTLLSLPAALGWMAWRVSRGRAVVPGDAARHAPEAWRVPWEEARRMRQCTARGGATPRGEALGTSGCPLACLASLGQQRQQGLTAGKRPRGPGTGGHGPRCMRSYVMLVESDIREGIRGILP